MSTLWSVIAQAAYEAYCMVARSDVSMLSVPDWEDLPPRLQDAWREAAQEVCRLCRRAPLYEDDDAQSTIP